MEHIKKIEVINNGQKFVYDVLLMFKDEETQKEYVIYTDSNDAESNILAAIYNSNNSSIEYIESEEEKEMISQILETVKNRFSME